MLLGRIEVVSEKRLRGRRSRDWSTLSAATILSLACFFAGFGLTPFQTRVEAEPATQDASTASVRKEIQEANSRLHARFRNRWELLDEDRRDEIMEHGLPEIVRLVRAYQQVREGEAKPEKLMTNELSLLTILVSWGNSEGEASLKKLAQDARSPWATAARAGLLVGRWMQGRRAPTQQSAVLQEMHRLAVAHPVDDKLVPLIAMMCRYGAATPALRTEAIGILANDLQVSRAKQMASRLTREAEMRHLEGKPLVLTGTTLQGKSFTTGAWKNKVIVVSFWATWCAPCRKELQWLKSLYAKHHNIGLEIVGVPCDRQMEPLVDFLAQHSDMPWPQLVDPRKSGPHVLARQCCVQGLPTIFVIDRTGVVRSVAGREDGERLIPLLLGRSVEKVRPTEK